MALYEYKGFHTSGRNAGRETKGVQEAANKQALRELLLKKGIALSGAVERNQAAKAGGGTKIKFQIGSGVSKQDVREFTSQFSTLQHADIPLVECLTALSEQTENEQFRNVLADVKTKVCEGTSLASAMGDHPKVFDTLYVSMIKAGESSGSLDVVLQRLSDVLESQQRTRSKVVGAMVYPMIMIVIGCVLLIVIFVFVIPRVTKMFEQQQKELPGITQLLLNVAYAFTHFWWAIILVIAALAFGFKKWIETPGGKMKWDHIKIRIPILGNVLKTSALSRFAKTLSTLLSSGVPLLDALTIVRSILGNEELAKIIDESKDNIREGDSLSAPLKRSGQFPPLMTNMIASGERAGQLELMLDNVATEMENQVNAKVEAMTALLEPLMIVVMGGTIGFVVIAIMLPIMQLSDGFG